MSTNMLGRGCSDFLGFRLDGLSDLGFPSNPSVSGTRSFLERFGFVSLVTFVERAMGLCMLASGGDGGGFIVGFLVGFLFFFS